MDVLRVENLSKRYGRRWVVRDLSFSVGKGEVVGFLGQNGAGKSTTIKILCNLVRPTSGDILLDGRSILSGGGVRHREKMGVIVEAPRFYPQLSGLINLQMLGRLYGVPKGRVESLLERVGLADRSDERFGRYSMGMKQRLGLAAVLLNEPSLIILDEPTNGLDPVGSRQIRELIARLAKAHRASILLCSHHLDEVAALCSRALVLHEGRLLLEQDLAGPEGIAAVRAAFENIARDSGAA